MPKPAKVQLLDLVEALHVRWLCPYCACSCESKVRRGTTSACVRCGKCHRSVDLSGLSELAKLSQPELETLLESSPMARYRRWLLPHHATFHDLPTYPLPDVDHTPHPPSADEPPQDQPMTHPMTHRHQSTPARRSARGRKEQK